MPLHCIGLLLTTYKHYLLKKYITCALLSHQNFSNFDLEKGAEIFVFRISFGQTMLFMGYTELR